jgi:hypothetical protein
MHLRTALPRALAVAAVLAAAAPAVAQSPAAAALPPVAKPDTLATGAFKFSYALTLPGTPDRVWEMTTSGLGEWWDHTMSEKPHRLYIDAKAGGGFWEIMDTLGNGVRHAEVTFAQRPALLRFEGPLGLTGSAIHMVHTFQYAPVGADSTRLTLEVHAAGEMGRGWDAMVSQVWRHFLFEALKPHAERRARGGTE